MSRIKVLIVDDSPFIRRVLERILTTDPELEVAGFAQNGREAVEKVLSLEPDVVTLDVMMPVMDGIEALGLIMERRPTPVLMLSQFTQQGAELTLNALEMGAMDFVDKSSTGLMDFLALASEIVSKIKAIASSKPQKKPLLPAEPSKARSEKGDVDVVAIGTSTGGPTALQMILPKFDKNIPFGLVIVQHMPRGFTNPLARRLDSISLIHIKEAEEGDRVQPGLALIAPAGLHMTLSRAGKADADSPPVVRSKVKLDVEPVSSLHKPSADVLFTSVAKCYGERAMGVLLTGMGADGAKGMKVIKEKGGVTFAQNEESCVIFGMPRVAIEMGVVDRVIPLTSMADEIIKKA